jgi:hypothetical protein
LKFSKFETLISAQRLSRYKASCGNDTRKTTRLYRANIRISQAFLATLSIFEVVLRNKIDHHYKRQFPVPPGGHDWLLASILPGGFLTQPGCQRTLDKINKAYTGLGASYTHDKLLAELSFGTWKFMFAGKQFQAGGNTLLNIFPNLPPHHNQGFVYSKLNQINAIRNRVAHHEPICFGIGNTIGTAYARSHFQDIIDILTWMGIHHRELFFGIDGVLKEADYIDNI